MLKPIAELLNYKDSDNNVNKYILNNGINVNTLNKYKLDKTKFIPNTEESQLAEEIGIFLRDENFACFYSVVKKIGCSEARRLLKNVLSDIEEKNETKTPVRKPGAYFMWKYKRNLY